MNMIFRCLLLLFLSLSHFIEASYIRTYTTTDNGGIAWTGNTLGLNKRSDQNNPGTNGSIGAFITQNTAVHVGSFPAGTTLNWTLNGSSAVLDLPPLSEILHAELIWSGSYGFDPALPLATAQAASVTFITPDNVSHIVAPNPATAQSRVNSGSNGFYVNSQDVTALLTALPTQTGTYIVGGVPGTAIASENNLNCAGWTLAVAYHNPSMLTSNLTIFVGCEASGAPAAVVNGFKAPDIGVISSRLFVSALEGDAQLTGDHFLVGNTSSLSYPANGLSGTNNPGNNFFCSQINTILNFTTDVTTGKISSTGSGLLDTRGSFGLTNSNPATGTGVSGARQGYDATSIDIGSLIVNGQQQIYTQGTTTNDIYTITAIGVQIQVKAPLIEATKESSATTAIVGDIITFTNTFTNAGELDANSVLFKDPLPPGLELNTESLTIDGVPFANPDLDAGIPLGTLAIGDTVVIEFTVTVTSANPPSSYVNISSVDYGFTPINSTPVTLTAATNPVTITTPDSDTGPVANPDTGITNANTVLNGTSVLANDTGTGISVSAYDPITTEGGTVSMLPTGVYLYTPPNNFSGTDTFTYTIIDSSDRTATTTVTITVLPVANADTAQVSANTLLTETTSVLSNDFGTDLSVTSYDTTSSQGGTVVMQPDGTYTYMPPLDFSGVDTFNYTATDSSGNTTSTIVTIIVLPKADNDFGQTPANTTLNGATVFTNDQGQGLFISAYDHTSVEGGTVVMDTITGTYTYNPPTGFSGIDSFTYTVTDQDGNSNVATVTITVLPIGVDNTGTTNANVPLNQTISVLDNDIGTNLTVSDYNATTVQGGTVVMQADGTYVYTPPLNFSGTDSFDYTATDGTSTTIAKVTITVLPSASPDTATTFANQTLNGSSVLSNDAGSTLTVTAFQTPSAQGGTVSMNTDGTYEYVPPLNFSGIDTFTYTVTDSSNNSSTATVTITVLPVVVNDTETTQANTPLVVPAPGVLENDIGTDLTVFSYTTPSHGTVVVSTDGSYTYTPDNGYSGPDSFTYTVEDSSGQQATATVTITVMPIARNDQNSTSINTPLIVNAQNGVLKNDVGTNLTVISYTATTTQGGTVMVSPDGSYAYTPPVGFTGIDTFRYTIQDAYGNKATAIVTITVSAIMPPQDFVGSLTKSKGSKCCTFTATWSPSTSPNISGYRLYYNGRFVTEIPARGPLVYVKLKQKCKYGCVKGYSLSAVNTSGKESPKVPITFN